jgi:hypothetical protein
MDILMWGPAYDYELSYRREQIRSMWGAPSGRRHGRHGATGARRRRGGADRTARIPGRIPGRGWALPGSGAWPAA